MKAESKQSNAKGLLVVYTLAPKYLYRDYSNVRPKGNTIWTNGPLGETEPKSSYPEGPKDPTNEGLSFRKVI